jgi:hypothetical protein
MPRVLIALLVLAPLSGLAEEPAAPTEVLPTVGVDRNLGVPYRASQHVEAPLDELRKRVEASQVTFEAALIQHDGAYTYTRTFTSWAGFGDISRVKVKDGTVVEHAYRAHDPQETTREAWIERGEEVGSHDRQAHTMEVVYARCLGETLRKDPKRYAVRVSFFDDGILATCSYRDRACADDCTEGLSVEHFHFGDPTASVP